MTDYKTTGLDQNLFSNSLPNNNLTSAYDFNANNERDNVTSFNVQEINASKITAGTIAANIGYLGTLNAGQLSGGTLTLGGTLNGNGLIQVKDSNGTATLQIDNTGISMINGTSIVDGVGLNSINNFSLGGTNNVASFSTTSTSYVPIPGGTISSFVLDREARVLLGAKVTGRVTRFSLSDAQGTFRIYDSSTSSTKLILTFTGDNRTNVDWDDGTGLINSITYYSIDNTTSGMFMGNYSAGTHTLVAQVASSSATGTLHVNDLDIFYIVYGR